MTSIKEKWEQEEVRGEEIAKNLECLIDMDLDNYDFVNDWAGLLEDIALTSAFGSRLIQADSDQSGFVDATDAKPAFCRQLVRVLGLIQAKVKQASSVSSGKTKEQALFGDDE